MNGTFRIEYGDGRECVCMNPISTVGENHIIDTSLSVEESHTIPVFQLEPRCKTCCWYATGLSHHQCTCPKMVYGYGIGEADKDGVNVEDDEGWGMVPGPDFGCIHYEEKSDV